ncbi:EF-hand domain-containing protein [Yoonia sp. SS1-5]|uniref:EF-hand domain-containing protein n=1 Tax=Yoonia rhodophyticola TaxID=3137370 RepID=A0AAN0NK74_9RHOB
MKKTAMMTMFVLALSGVAGAASADDRPDFATLDSNGDGALSLAEIQARGQMRFDEADSNADGALSAEELAAASARNATERSARMLERLDANGDGLLQRDEMQPRGGDRAAKMFERVDADGDGQLSEAEFDAAKARWGNRRGGPRGRG